MKRLMRRLSWTGGIVVVGSLSVVRGGEIPRLRPGPIRQDYANRQGQSELARQRLLDNVIGPVLRRHGLTGDPRSYISLGDKGEVVGAQRSNSVNHDLFAGTDLSLKSMEIGSDQANAIANDIAAALKGSGSATVERVGNFGRRTGGGDPDALQITQRDRKFRADVNGRVDQLRDRIKTRGEQSASGSHIHVQLNQDINDGDWQKLKRAAANEVPGQDPDTVKKELARQQAWTNKPANTTGWRCNAYNAVHQSPDQCADPDKGGVWLTGNGTPGPTGSGLSLPPPGPGDPGARFNPVPNRPPFVPTPPPGVPGGPNKRPQGGGKSGPNSKSWK